MFFDNGRNHKKRGKKQIIIVKKDGKLLHKHGKIV